MENLARYIIYPEGHTQASFSQERMQYLDQEGNVVYTSKACPRTPIRGQQDNKSFHALEWLPLVFAHTEQG